MCNDMSIAQGQFNGFEPDLSDVAVRKLRLYNIYANHH